MQFEFKRNLSLNETSNPNVVAKNLFYNQIYINMSVGSLKQEIPFYIYLHQYPCVIEPSNITIGQVKGLFNESLSETYKIIKDYDYFVNGDMTKGILSSDNFYVNNKNILNSTFYLSKENKARTHITEGNKIGFKLYPPHFESTDTSFIKNLKKNNLIFSYVFLLKYNSNNNKEDEDKGQLIIGAFPHLYDKVHYKEQYYTSDKAEKGYTAIDWIFKFDEIKVDEEIIEKSEKEIYFYYELGFIIGSKDYFEYIKKQESFNYYFENNPKCNKMKISIDDLEVKEFQQKLKGDYFVYYCEKDVDVKNINISKLSFVKKNMNYTFYLEEKDFWIEKGNYNYFIIIEKNYYNSYWCFGKPFFKKYDIVFDYDNSQIGFYTKIVNGEEKEEENNNLYVYIISIVILVIIIALLIFWLIKCYLNLPRKKRANELLDDNYEYEEQKDKKLIN